MESNHCKVYEGCKDEHNEDNVQDQEECKADSHNSNTNQIQHRIQVWLVLDDLLGVVFLFATGWRALKIALCAVLNCKVTHGLLEESCLEQVLEDLFNAWKINSLYEELIHI